jgi:hypothetical protein
MDNAVMTMENCTWTITARCPYGCKIGASFAPGSDAFCNDSPDAGGDAPDSAAPAADGGDGDGDDGPDGLSDTGD